MRADLGQRLEFGGWACPWVKGEHVWSTIKLRLFRCWIVNVTRNAANDEHAPVVFGCGLRHIVQIVFCLLLLQTPWDPWEVLVIAAESFMVMTGEFEVSNELSTVLSTDLDIFFQNTWMVTWKQLITIKLISNETDHQSKVDWFVFKPHVYAQKTKTGFPFSNIVFRWYTAGDVADEPFSVGKPESRSYLASDGSFGMCLKISFTFVDSGRFRSSKLEPGYGSIRNVCALLSIGGTCVSSERAN